MKIVVIFTNIKRFLYLISLISVVLMYMDIYPYICLPITIISIMIGLFLAACFTQKLGTPSNVVDSEKIIYIPNINSEIKVLEIERGIWQIQDNKYNTTFDMRNWVKRKKYILEIITTFLVLDSYNHSSQVAYSLPYGKQKFKNQSVELEFIGKKKNKKKIIVKDYYFIKTLYNRFRFRLCLKGVRFSQYKNTKHYELKMKDIYIFKQNK